MINGFQTPNELIQAGIFGMGPNSSLNQWTGRDDLSFQPLWQLEGFGLGNLARIKEQRGEESRAIIELFKTQDMVAADVTRAQRGSSRRRCGSSRPIAPAHGHHHLQRQLRGPAADHPLRRRPGPGQPPAGGGLRPPAHEAGLRRVLHHGRRLQPGAVRAVPRAGLPRRRSSRSGSPRARSSRSTLARPIPAPGRQRPAPGDPLIDRLSSCSPVRGSREGPRTAPPLDADPMPNCR